MQCIPSDAFHMKAANDDRLKKGRVDLINTYGQPFHQIHKRRPLETANGANTIAKSAASKTRRLNRNNRFLNGILRQCRMTAGAVGSLKTKRSGCAVCSRLSSCRWNVRSASTGNPLSTAFFQASLGRTA